jgi:hypothetical protein
MPSDRTITILAIVASVFLGAFLFVLVVPPLVFGLSSPVVNYAGLQLVRVILFFGSVFSLFGVGPYLIYSFRQRSRLEQATNHYIKNKLAEIVLALDLLEANLIASPSPEMTYEEKIDLLNDVKFICKDMSQNLMETILKEAPGFDRTRNKQAVRVPVPSSSSS